jgi:hypothetical protein
MATNKFFKSLLFALTIAITSFGSSVISHTYPVLHNKIIRIHAAMEN